MRRALVIGLGNTAHNLLDQVDQYFHDEGARATLKTLWLPPYLPPAAAGAARQHHTPDLTLTHQQLSQLYYQPDVRVWSGPNWKDWGDRLPANRMLGRLVMYEYRPTIVQAIIDQLKSLMIDSKPVNLYLVADLSDPFASGACLDLAYILNEIALEWKIAKTYGLFFVPGTAQAPVDEAEDEEVATAAPPANRDLSLRYATAYAALRELYFVLGPSSFYDHHHPAGLHRRDIENESPFQTGDCYLVGGDLDAAKRSLDMEKVLAQVVEWIYYQTVSDLTGYFTMSKNNQHMVSSFGMQRLFASIIEDPALLDDVTTGLLQHMLETTQQDGAAVAAQVERWFHLALADEHYETFYQLIDNLAPPRAGGTLLGRRVEMADNLRHLDRQVADAAQHLINIEGRLNDQPSAQLLRRQPEIQAELAAWQARSGMTLARLEAMHSDTLQTANRLYRDAQRQFEQLEETIDATVAHLREQRFRAEHASARMPLLIPFTLAITVVTWVLVGFLLLVSGLSLWALAWALALVLPLGLIARFQNRRYRLTLGTYVKTQRELLLLQQQLIHQRTRMTYFQSVRKELETLLVQQIDTDAHALRVQLEDLLDLMTAAQNARPPAGVEQHLTTAAKALTDLVDALRKPEDVSKHESTRARLRATDCRDVLITLQASLPSSSDQPAIARLADTLRQVLRAWQRNVDDTVEQTERQAILRVTHLREQLEAVWQHYQATNPQLPPEIEARLADQWQPISRVVIQQLWNQLEERRALTPQGIAATIQRLIKQQMTLNLTLNEQTRLQQLIDQTLNQSAIMLGVNETQFEESAQDPPTRVLGLVGWSPSIVGRLAEDYQQRGHVRLVDITSQMAHQAAQGQQVITLHIQNNIPLGALLHLPQWRQAYQQMCFYQDNEDQLLTFRSFLHPTRAGIASPDVRTGLIADYENLTVIVMGFCAALHALHQYRQPHSKIEEELSKAVRVECNPTPNFDELCGGLQERPAVLLNQDRRTAESERQPLARLKTLWQTIESLELRVSETYADWEIWTIETIARALRRGDLPNSMYRLGQLVIDWGLEAAFAQSDDSAQSGEPQ